MIEVRAIPRHVLFEKSWVTKKRWSFSGHRISDADDIKKHLKTSSNGKKQFCGWKFFEIENLLETFYQDNNKNMVFYLH